MGEIRRCELMILEGRELINCRYDIHHGVISADKYTWNMTTCGLMENIGKHREIVKTFLRGRKKRVGEFTKVF